MISAVRNGLRTKGIPMTSRISRRTFLGASAAAVAAVSFPAFAVNPFMIPKKWDRTVDILVIGAGGAGLSAAITAKEAGVKNVVIVEKTAFPGGNTTRAGGGFNAAIKADYEKLGIKDSPELHASQTLRQELVQKKVFEYIESLRSKASIH